MTEKIESRLQGNYFLNCVLYGMKVGYIYLLIVYQETSRDISTFSFLTIFWEARDSQFIYFTFFIIKINSRKLDNFWWIFDLRLELNLTNYLPQHLALSLGTADCPALSPGNRGSRGPEISWLGVWLYAEIRPVSWGASNYDNDKDSPQY